MTKFTKETHEFRDRPELEIIDINEYEEVDPLLETVVVTCRNVHSKRIKTYNVFSDGRHSGNGGDRKLDLVRKPRVWYQAMVRWVENDIYQVTGNCFDSEEECFAHYVGSNNHHLPPYEFIKAVRFEV